MAALWVEHLAGVPRYLASLSGEQQAAVAAMEASSQFEKGFQERFRHPLSELRAAPDDVGAPLPPKAAHHGQGVLQSIRR